jgi:hypothetical protein
MHATAIDKQYAQATCSKIKRAEDFKAVQFSSKTMFGKPNNEVYSCSQWLQARHWAVNLFRSMRIGFRYGGLDALMTGTIYSKTEENGIANVWRRRDPHHES